MPAERRGLGLVFQSYALWPHLTVAQNVEFGLKLRKIDRSRASGGRIAEVLDVLGIGGLAARYPSQLSGGQQQRVALGADTGGQSRRLADGRTTVEPRRAAAARDARRIAPAA